MRPGRRAGRNRGTREPTIRSERRLLRRGARFCVFAGLLAGLLGIRGATLGTEAGAEAVPPEPEDVASDVFTIDTLPPRASLREALRERQLPEVEVSRVQGLLAPHRRGTRYGNPLRLVASAAGGVEAVELVLAPERLLRVYRAGGRRWDREIVHVDPVTDTVVVTGRLAPQAHYAVQRRSEGGVDPRAAINRVARRLVVDPELRSGDGYHAIVEREVGTDGSLVGVRVLAVRFQGLAGPVTALRRDAPGDPRWEDPAGRSLSRALIPPMAFARVTSDFDRGRYHPVLKRRIPHLGVDFAGWYSTPVRAAAEGEVTYRGWFGAHGRMVEISHPDGRRTRYSHLLRYRTGLGVGDRVSQGEFIGVVGSSGLANGPHLHFSLIEDGEYLDPMSGMTPPLPAVGEPRPESGPPARAVAERYGRLETEAASDEVALEGRPPAQVGASRSAGLTPEDARLVALLDEARASVAPGSWALARLSGEESPGS